MPNISSEQTHSFEGKVMLEDGFKVLIKNYLKNTDFSLDLKDWRNKIDMEIKEMQSQLKGELSQTIEDPKKKNKKKKKDGVAGIETNLENDGLVKFSKLLINTKKLTVVEKFVESVQKC